MWAIFIATYLASQVWLSGSVLIPIMLLVPTGAAKWRGLHPLATGRKRWVLILGCYGATKAALLSGLVLYVWHRDPLAVLPFESLGWAWMAVDSVLHVFHIAIGDAIAFALSLSLKVASEAATDAGLAAIAWWAYGVLTRKLTAQRRTLRYGACLLLVTCGFGIANNSYFWRSGCTDCFAPHGIPFTFFHEGGFAGSAGFLWMGVVENSIAVLIVAFVSGLVWDRLATLNLDLGLSP